MTSASAQVPAGPPGAAARVLVVIVNYKTAGLTIDCLRSLAPEIAALPRAAVIVADNLSPDDSVEKLRLTVAREGWSPWASVVALERNGGFAYGNNRVIEGALAGDQPPELVWLLNPDTVVRPGGLVRLVEFMAEHPRCAIAGSRLEDPDETVQTAAFRFPGLLSELEGSANLGPLSNFLGKHRVWLDQPEGAEPVDWVSGASMMVRREVFQAVGLLDERYFMYFEELDFCLRGRKAGFQSWHVPQSRVVHLVGQASGLTGEKTRERRRPAYWFCSRRWFWVKNHGAGRAIAADLARIGGTALYLVGMAARRRPNDLPPCYLRDLMRHSVFLGGFRP